MGILYWLLFSCTSSVSRFDTSIDEVNGAESFAVTSTDLQESLNWFFTEVGVIRLSNLLKFEADNLIVDPVCPAPFPALEFNLSIVFRLNHICVLSPVRVSLSFPDSSGCTRLGTSQQ